MSEAASRLRRLAAFFSKGFLLLVAAISLVAVLLIIFYIARDALPFFRLRGLTEFFTSTAWFPSGQPPEFGALAIFVGSGLVTLGAILVAVPLGVAAAVCLSDVLPFACARWSSRSSRSWPPFPRWPTASSPWWSSRRCCRTAAARCSRPGRLAHRPAPGPAAHVRWSARSPPAAVRERRGRRRRAGILAAALAAVLVRGLAALVRSADNL